MKRLVLAAVALVFACVPAQTSAGVYTVRACLSGGHDPHWSVGATVGVSAVASCPAAAGIVRGYAIASPLTVAASPQGAIGTWRVAAPPTTRISSLSLQRYLRRWWDWNVEIVTEEGATLETCDVPWTATYCERGVAGGSPAQNTVAYGHLGTSAVTFRVRCSRPVGCSNQAASEHAVLAIYRADLVIEDPERPAVRVAGGSFADAGWHKGTDTVAVVASDASGVKSLRVVSGTRELGARTTACDYTLMQPCPSSLAESFSFDTALLPDGTHELRVVATDAADQEGVATETIRVDRGAPLAPAGLAVMPNQDGTYALRWTDVDQGTASPIVATHYAICDGATCQPAQRVVGPANNLGLPAGRYSLRVWLEDEAGNFDPARASTVSVDTTALRSGRPVDTKPPILLPSGPTPSSRIKLTRARRSGSTLTLSGTIARGASARISASLSRTRAGKAVTTGRTTPRRGKWSLKLRLSPSMRSAGAMYLTLRFAGQADFRKTTLKRKLARKASSGANTAVEFSIETGR